ncbi:type I secretion system permease/ATPase [Shimia abyssi]|uniref:ATP-binding cassette subfamily C protein n=1 Tax=Shimia abyssi TaxID=1662395 RepID=A0A2P8F784_9RHOB|nr:type I secretion system permease/ATPase [Shimia abyssi]PSL17557.1 ATP-binding cassette subfamily C protein [Shimia abyssi]
MSNPQLKRGREELRKAWNANRLLFIKTFVFSMFVNALMLTGPIFMLQIYDRVLGSGSEETLVSLFILMAFLFAMMGMLDYARGRLMARAGARFQSRLDERVFGACLDIAARQPDKTIAAQQGLRDLESVQKLLASPVLLAVFDIPWTPLFLMAIYIFHPLLGTVAVIGGSVLISLAILNQWTTSRAVAQANSATVQAEHLAHQYRNDAAIVYSLGMKDAAFKRWLQARGVSLASGISSSDKTGFFSSSTKTLRLFLQSAMLGVGAWVVLQGEMSAGSMIAGSILLGRALAPVEQAIGQWPLVQMAWKGWKRLGELLSTVPPEVQLTDLPKPKASLEAIEITIVPPGERKASLRLVSFDLQPGQAMGVIGPSGSGKSSLAQAITGIWRPVTGALRFDSAGIGQYNQDTLGRYIGYLPQAVTLFDGTIAENIARLNSEPDSEKVVEAAKRAAVHEMIVKLPDGYDTRVSAAASRLSGGQIQRIGLARAMYEDPVILVLDEPNSNLDADGSKALNAAIRQFKADGNAVIIMAHRPAAIQECDTLLVLEDGMRKAFGPRDEVLSQTLRNADIVQKNIPDSKVTPLPRRAAVPGSAKRAADETKAGSRSAADSGSADSNAVEEDKVTTNSDTLTQKEKTRSNLKVDDTDQAFTKSEVSKQKQAENK